MLNNNFVKLFNSVHLNDYYQIDLSLFDRNIWNYLIVCKQICSGSFKNVTYKLFAYKNKYIYLLDLALDNSQRLICHKIQSKQTKPKSMFQRVLNVSFLVYIPFDSKVKF